jgi:hypothetical protein
VENEWTFQDLMDAHEVLDLKEDAQRQAEKK